MKLTSAFYSRPTLEVARDLLGQVLVRRSPLGACAGIIVETEAYTQNDPASHSHRGKTRRNATMFGRPGLSYVYLIYGLHYCFNVVTAGENIGEAVLIRALEPVAGIPLMQERRGIREKNRLCSGPARVCQALDITTREDGLDLLGDELFILAYKLTGAVTISTRIGISKAQDLPYRFSLTGSKYLSAK